jgi:dynein heavy chain
MHLESSVVRKLSTICKKMHQNVIDLSFLYKKYENRINYVTPSIYLELMKNMKLYLYGQKKKLEEKMNVYKNGVNKILSTQEQVKKMEIELNEKQPILMHMNTETAAIAEEIRFTK